MEKINFGRLVIFGLKNIIPGWMGIGSGVGFWIIECIATGWSVKDGNTVLLDTKTGFRASQEVKGLLLYRE